MDPTGRGNDDDASYEHLKRFSIQPSRLMSKAAGGMVPRRRASVSNGQAAGGHLAMSAGGHEFHSGGTLAHDPGSSYVTMDSTDMDYPMGFSPYPMAARVNSLREQYSSG